VDEVVDLVLKRTQEIAPPYWNWDREERNVLGMCESFLKKHPQLKKKSRRAAGI
jgi:hypothetical protein